MDQSIKSSVEPSVEPLNYELIVYILSFLTNVRDIEAAICFKKIAKCYRNPIVVEEVCLVTSGY